jgi:capsular polysaccharide transport system permease protein
MSMADLGRSEEWNGVSPMNVFFAALRVEMRIVGALMLREIMTRFGRENIGFVWLMGEPFLLTAGVMIAWSISKNFQGHNVGILPFVLTGYAMITLWRHIVSQAVHCFRHNAGLLFHRNVGYIDTLLAKALLETVGGAIAFCFAYIPLCLLDLIDPIDDYLTLIGAWMLMAWLSFSVALILAGITEISEAAERFIQPILYLTLPLSGTFYMVEWLPRQYRDLAEYSPLINANEMFRGGLLGDSVTTYWSAWYLTLWCIGLTALGLVIVMRARRMVRFE